MSNIIAHNIQAWRAKALAGTLTPEECRLAIDAIRKERTLAGAISDASRTRKTAAKEKAKPIDSDDLLAELGM
jgi:hypothetical protein